MKKETIAVWFSCGAASAVAAKLTIEKYSENYNVRVINNPIANEHYDNTRFLTDVEKWIGQKIEISKNEKFKNCDIVEVFDKQKYVSGRLGAPCTSKLKKDARKQWENINKPEHTVLGFTVDEQKRHERFCLTERELIPVLINENLTKDDCFNIIKKAGIELPFIYKQGFPNANCIGCVKSQSPTYWNLVRSKYPTIFKSRAEQSRRIGCKLVKIKGERKFLDELKITDKGGKLKGQYIECGIFCEESFDLK